MSKLLHYISSVQSGVWGEEQKNDENDVRCIRVADFEYSKLGFVEPETIRNIPDKNRYLIKKGDILIEKSGGGEKTTVGRAIYIDKDYEFVYANFIDRLRPKNSEYGKFMSYFLAYIYGNRLNTKYIKQNTGIQNLDVHDYIREEISLPDEKDWGKIVQFLDQKVAKIDEVVVKKKQLLQLLEEKRISIINDIVRDSKGEKTKIKHIATVNPATRHNFKFAELVSFVPMEAISEYGEVSPQERKIQDVTSGYTYFEENNVVIAKITPCFENGKAAVMQGLQNHFGFGTTEFIVLRASNKILPVYLYYLIFSRHFRENGTNEMRGTAGQKRLTESYVGHYEFNLPSKEVQEKLVKQVDDATSKIDKAKNKITESIALLEEYKTSLISNAVIGSIKI